MFSLARLVVWARNILLPLGGPGLFVAAALDSSFVPLPEGVDLWLVTLSVLQPARMPYYVLLATLGSLLGCIALFLVVRWSEETFVEKNPKYSGLARVQRLVEKYESGALVVGAILPPPTPLKLVVIAAGLMKCRFRTFVAALLLGRVIRYLGEGLLAVRYGRQAWRWLVRAGPVVLGLVALVIVIAFLIRRLRKKASPQVDQ